MGASMAGMAASYQTIHIRPHTQYIHHAHHVHRTPHTCHAHHLHTILYTDVHHIHHTQHVVIMHNMHTTQHLKKLCCSENDCYDSSTKAWTDNKNSLKMKELAGPERVYIPELHNKEECLQMYRTKGQKFLLGMRESPGAGRAGHLNN